MTVSMRQQARVGAYLVKQKLKRRERFPLLVELEPLFACNLACAGCGKIQYPPNILKQRMTVETAVAAIEESGAPMVSIAGGEPLIHPEIHLIAKELVDRKKLSPAYAYWKAPDQDHFLGVEETRTLFREVFAGGARKRWRLNHSPLFLDFLEGKVDFQCTPWGIPCYTIFGWQRPCYLQSDGYTATYRELLETTDWSKYGRHSGNVQCRNCMAHCGYEPTAVLATMGSLKQSVRALVGS